MDKKRYILFAYYTYYPGGGMDDAKVSFEEEEYEEVKNIWTGKYDHYQIFDTVSFKTFDGANGNLPKI